jgi:hypothetical protein
MKYSTRIWEADFHIIKIKNYLQEKNSEENKDKKYTYREFVNQKEKEYGESNFYAKDYVTGIK